MVSGMTVTDVEDRTGGGVGGAGQTRGPVPVLPEELVAAVASLLGFRPVESLVVVVVRDGTVRLTGCWSIEALIAGTDLLQAVREFMGDGGDGLAAQVFVVGFGLRSAPLARALCADLGEAVAAALVVAGDGWRSLDPPGQSDGPAGSTVGVWGPEGGAGSDRSARGRASARIAAPTGVAEDQMMGVFLEALDGVDEDRPTQTGQMVLALMEDWWRGEQLTDRAFLTAGIAMSAAPVRDRVWAELTVERARRYLPFWEEVLSRTPAGVRTIALAVAGVFAWIASDARLAEVCLDEAEETDRDYPLVRLLRRMVTDGPPVSCWLDAVREVEGAQPVLGASEPGKGCR